MSRKKKDKIETCKKIVVRIDIDEYKRLCKIRDEYGFKSNYEIMQYATACILRIADPIPDEEQTLAPIPDEIAELFSDLAEADRKFDYVKPKRKLSQYKLDEINGQLRLWD